MTSTNHYNGVENLLTPDNHALLPIDHQYLQLLTIRSHEATTVVANAAVLPRASKIFHVPTVLTWA
jgi:hypothetical protein